MELCDTVFVPAGIKPAGFSTILPDISSSGDFTDFVTNKAFLSVRLSRNAYAKMPQGRISGMCKEVEKIVFSG